MKENPNSHSARYRSKHYFHPLEISVCGLSGSGKTTLIEKLAGYWRDRSFAYVKHDAHGFEMDRPGKDTYRIARAGARAVLINDSCQTALLQTNAHEFASPSYLQDYDFVVVEGYKQLAIPKIIVLDRENSILNSLPDGQKPILYVGACGEDEMIRKNPALSPYVNRDRIDAIAKTIDAFFAEKVDDRPLLGLVLAGGRSSRMGQDKSFLQYQGRTQLDRCQTILGRFCDEIFVSTRAEQAKAPAYAKYKKICDVFSDMGPLGGILSAMKARPECAWLVLAIDLPNVNHGTIDNLLKRRDRFKYATVYRSNEGSFVEPLCAIYEPKCYSKFLALFGSGIECPADILARLPIYSIEQKSAAKDLVNINYWSEYQFAMGQLRQREEGQDGRPLTAK